MARDFAYKFYNSTAWRKMTAYIKTKNHGLCQKCGEPGLITHHIIPLTPENIDDPNITLNEELLMYLCQTCHNQIHGDVIATRDDVMFDDEGNLVRRE